MIVGLTGGIASGKSESARYFEALGAYCIDADAISKDLTTKGAPALKNIVDHFGTEILLPDGNLDRKQLANVVFSDINAKLKVEELLHRHIISRINEIIANNVTEESMIVINAPLLFEVGLDKVCNKTIVVHIPFDIQIKRLALRDGMNDEEIKKRISSQMPTKEKLEIADFVIDNSGSKDDLKKNVTKLYKLLTSKFE